jgi:hypothetical protein
VEEEINMDNKKAKKAKKTNGAASLASHFAKKQGSGVDVVHDNNSWQVSMLDIWRGEVELAQVKWDSQEKQQSRESALSHKKWAAEKQQQNLQYKFDLMVKYKQLQEQGFDNHQIVNMIPDMQPILDKVNMPVHVQLTAQEETEEVEDQVIDLD